MIQMKDRNEAIEELVNIRGFTELTITKYEDSIYKKLFDYVKKYQDNHIKYLLKSESENGTIIYYSCKIKYRDIKRDDYITIYITTSGENEFYITENEKEINEVNNWLIRIDPIIPESLKDKYYR